MLWWSLVGLFVFGAVISYWQVVIPLAVVAVVAAVWWGRWDYRRREYERLRRAADEAYVNGL